MTKGLTQVIILSPFSFFKRITPLLPFVKAFLKQTEKHISQLFSPSHTAEGLSAKTCIAAP